MFNVYVNNIKIAVNSHSTVLQACELLHIEIPKFCFNSSLSIAGNCRMCLVEIANAPKPIASCAMPVTDKMRIYTNTPLVKKARESILEFLLINHPLDCPICDQGGECDLQDQTLSFGSTASRFLEIKRTVEDKFCGTFIKTVMTRCIHCTRCVRFTNEICGIDELGTTGRGNRMEISFYINQIFKSEFSGNVIDLCPVGALTSKIFAFKARAWELKKTKTIDILDSLGSNIIIQTFNNKIVRILPKINKHLNIEWITDKTRFFFDSLNYQRITTPMLKTQNKFLQISWEQAFQLIKQKVSETDSANQTVLIGNLIDIKSLYIFKNFIHSIGSRNVVYTTNYNNPNLQSPVKLQPHFITPLNKISEIDLCLLLFCDPRKESALLNLTLRAAQKKNNMKIFSIGPNLDLTYPIITLGLNLHVLLKILEGKHNFCKEILNAKGFTIIVGSNIFRIPNATQIIQKLQNKFTVNLLNFEPGFLNFNELFQSKNTIKTNGQLLFLYNTDSSNLTLNSFAIYFGHHFTQNAQDSNLILPCTTFLEKSSYFLTLEHKFQQTVQALKNTMQSKQDSLLFSNLQFYIDKTIKTDQHPKLSKLNPLQKKNFFFLKESNSESIKVTTNLLTPILKFKTTKNVFEKYSKHLSVQQSQFRKSCYYIKTIF